MYPRVPDSISISNASRCPDWSRTRSAWSTHRKDLFKSKVSHTSKNANAAMITMGTTIIWRSSDFNFEYSIGTSHSFPEDERTTWYLSLVGRVIQSAEFSWASAQVAPAAY